MVNKRERCGLNKNPCQNNNRTNLCPPCIEDNLCNRIKGAQESSKMLENVLDIATTLTKIMKVCGIDECKSSKALDGVIYAFMHFDEVSEFPGGKSKKRIRKEEFCTSMIRECGMTKNESKLSYSIVKSAFRAFYHKQIMNRYDASYIDECEWKNAANKTIDALALAGVSTSEVEIAGRRILCAYENYILRVKSKDAKTADKTKTCICGVTKQQSPQPQPCQNIDLQGTSPIDEVLCGRLDCEIVSPPGSLCPQLVCKDPAGRTFLQVDGEKVKFDPLIMECEARRAAMTICPTGIGADGFQKCLNTIKPPETKCKAKICDVWEDKEPQNENETYEKTKSECDLKSIKNIKKPVARSVENEEERHAAGNERHAAGSERRLKGFSILIGFSNNENNDKIIDVTAIGQCKIDGHFINSLEELELQYNDEQPKLYKTSPSNRLVGGLAVNNQSTFSLTNIESSSSFHSQPKEVMISKKCSEVSAIIPITDIITSPSNEIVEVV